MKEEIKTVNGDLEKFEQYYNDIEHLHKVFTELNFICIEETHDGFCPECKEMSKCKVFKEIKDEWERINS